MAIVGKKFPNLSVDAMNEMGDTFKVNVLEEAINNKKKVLFSGTQKILLLYAQQNYTLLKRRRLSLKKETPS